ncbi:MAG: hypothetical protein KC468_13070 [Myxococcales bacterium]|nr:hypothetical protein [Myxococcales bacterium]
MESDVIGAIVFFGVGAIGIIAAFIINHRLIVRSREVLDAWAASQRYTIVRRKTPLVWRGALAKYRKSDAVYDVTLRSPDGSLHVARVVIPYKPPANTPLLHVERCDDAP